MNKNYKSGFVSVVGRPNVGKSSIINAIVGKKVSITSPKAQTTRRNALGILNREDCQMIFVDTPGVQHRESALGKFMSKSTNAGMQGTDAILVVVSAPKLTEEDHNVLKGLEKSDVPVFVAINKVDIFKKDYQQVLPILSGLQKYSFVKEVFPVSAHKGYNLEKLTESLLECLPEGEPMYETDIFTDQNVRTMVAEIIREKALYILQEEIPHKLAVEIVRYEDKEKLTSISANIVCGVDAHKRIVIGKNGSVIKEIGEKSRKVIEKLIERKVYLDLQVKVREDWDKDKYMTSSFGYKEEDL